MPSPRFKPHRVIFRDQRGRFLSATHRYSKELGSVQIFRGGEYVTVIEEPTSPDELINLMSRPEFESLPEATVPFEYYESSKKYKAWDIAEQIDKTKRVRRKDLKFTIELQDGHRLRKISFYHKLKRNNPSSVEIWSRINQEIGLEGMFLYDKVGSKVLADRTGRQVTLKGIEVEEVL